MSKLSLETKNIDLRSYSILASNKQAKFLKQHFPYDLESIYESIEKIKINPTVVFFNSPDFDELINIFIHGKNDWLLEISPTHYSLFKYKSDHICESKSRKKLMKYLSSAILSILFTNWSFKNQEDNEYKNYFITTFKSFIKNLTSNTVKIMDFEELEYAESIRQEITQNSHNFVRVDLQPQHLPKFKLRKKKPIKDEKRGEYVSQELKSPLIPLNLNSFSDFENSETSWLEKNFLLKKLSLQYGKEDDKIVDTLHHFSDQLTKEFNIILSNLELIDGYGEENEQKLRKLVESIIDDKLAGRSSNKLIIGPQGTGKSSFAKLLGELMKARIITIECGPLTDNSDLFGSYEIVIDPETRQAVTIYKENGFMYASKLVKEGFKVVLAVEEYNLLPSETLLKQLNRFFQDRTVSSFGGRYEIELDKKDDIVVIMTGNHEFNQDWLNDVGLLRRFEFFEFPLPSTESVIDCLYKYVKNTEFNLRLSFECAERIAEIRDDLVSSIQEKTIRPILSKEIKYPDLYTLRNFGLDLIHDVEVDVAVKRWLVKIILGGVPNESDLREEYMNYSRIIQTTVEDRLPEIFIETLN